MNVWILIIFVFTQPDTSSCSALVNAMLKGTATIPCNVPENISVKPPLEVYWQKGSEVVLVTRDGQEDPEHQTKKYVNRSRKGPTDLMMYIDQLALTDEGTYQCIVFRIGNPFRQRIDDHIPQIQLKVLANFSYPEITQEPEGKVTKGTPVTLTCFSHGGYPDSQEVVWIMSSINDTTTLKGEAVKIQDNSTKLYNVNSSFTLNVTGNVNVSCVIAQTPPLEPVSRAISIELEEESTKSPNHTALIIVLSIIAVIVGAVAIAAAIVIRKRIQRCRERARGDSIEQGANAPPNAIPMLGRKASIEQEADSPQ